MSQSDCSETNKGTQWNFASNYEMKLKIFHSNYEKENADKGAFEKDECTQTSKVEGLALIKCRGAQGGRGSQKNRNGEAWVPEEKNEKMREKERRREHEGENRGATVRRDAQSTGVVRANASTYRLAGWNRVDPGSRSGSRRVAATKNQSRAVAIVTGFLALLPSENLRKLVLKLTVSAPERLNSGLWERWKFTSLRVTSIVNRRAQNSSELLWKMFSRPSI